MSKRRICLTPKSYSVPYIDVSPSKKHSLHRKTLLLTKTSSSVGTCSPQPQQADVEGEGESLCADIPVSFEFVGSSTDIQDQPLSSYSGRQQKAAEHWSEIRERLLCAAVEAAGFPYSGVNCIMCEQPAIAVCYDCGSRAFFCDDHLGMIHSPKINIFHTPQIPKVRLAMKVSFD